MTKIIFLLAPSEGKNTENKYTKEQLTFNLEKPFEIGKNSTEKDLKCSGNRYEEGIELNKNINNSGTTEAINRYSGVVFNAINYNGMNNESKKYFEENILIFSGMYGLLKPLDNIGNYKLPIETKGLYSFWGEKISKELELLKPDYIVNLLPLSYSKIIGIGKCSKLKSIRDNYTKSGTKIININFLKPDGTKISHGVKKYRGDFLKYICENNITNYEDFGGKVIDNGEVIDIEIKN